MSIHKTDEKSSRREFAKELSGIAAAGAALGAFAAKPAQAQNGYSSPGVASTEKILLDLAEYSYFWVGVEPVELARGTVANGKQMYIEYAIPRQLRHPYPIVLVHGGGGQGLDWMGTPDGRPGWFSELLGMGYAVYVVDRPGHGRSPYHPEVMGGWPAHHLALETMSGRFTPPNEYTKDANAYRKFHNQWPGTGKIGSPDLDQLVASQGGAYVQAGPQTQAVAHLQWRERGAMLLDKIGPAIIMTHSAGGPFGWLVAEIRPKLVKGIVAIEGGGQSFAGTNVWGMSSIPVEFDPPVKDPSEIKLVTVTNVEPGVQPYKLQAEPARKLKNLQGIPIVIVTAEGSFASPGNPGGVAMLKQAGCMAEELRLVDKGIHGNGHMMMVEKNNKQVLAAILEWVDAKVEKGTGVDLKNAPSNPKATETALKLADRGYFWVGTAHKHVEYGTLIAGQMYVQHFTPERVRHQTPIVLVHGGGGSMLHYMGIDQKAGWMHYYLQDGYRVYLVDRPGHGRVPYHPDTLGPMTPMVTYQSVTVDFLRGVKGNPRRWEGTGEVGDPSLDQFQAGQQSPPADNAMAHALWAKDGAELLDRIGPAIIQVHSAGGPFGVLVADQRPHLVKAIVNVEGAGNPFSAQTPWGITAAPLAMDPPVSSPKDFVLVDQKGYKLQAEGSVRKFKNLAGIPMVYVTAENSHRVQGPWQVAMLKQGGVEMEDLQLKSKGITGNGHFMMLENNRKQVYEVLNKWIEEKVKA